MVDVVLVDGFAPAVTARNPAVITRAFRAVGSMWRRRGYALEQIAIAGPVPPPSIRDWILVLVLAVSSAAELWFVDVRWPWMWAAMAALAIGLLPFRRRLPLEAALIAFTAELLVEILVRLFDLDDGLTLGQFVAGMVLIYAMCRWGSPRRVAIGMFVISLLLLAGEVVGDGLTPLDLFEVLPWFFLAAVALAMRYRARLGVVRDNEIRLTERNALARELHDSVAHHVAAIAVQVQAAQFIADDDPAGVKEALANVEEIANTTIDEMRRMVGVLRSDDDHAISVAASDLRRLSDSAANPPITFSNETTIDHLPTAVAAAVYRIAQESVTNARRHNRDLTYIGIDLTTDDDQVELEVLNDGSPSRRNSGGGYGLIGMNERVEALGGTMTSDARQTAGWRVHAIIPLVHPG